MDRIIIYGLGNIGKNIAECIPEYEKELAVEVIALVDKAKVAGQFQYPVLRPDDLVTLLYDYILVTSPKYYDEIKEELTEKYEISEDRITSWGKWVVGRGNRRYYCNLCSQNLPLMLKFGHESPVFSSKKIIGGGVRNLAVCPFCGSLDRNRWVEYVLENETKIYAKKSDILHFAPEAAIEARMRTLHQERYITADIEVGRADRVIDITGIDFPDDSFDYIICNHILEHIKDEAKAFYELQRCLREDGEIIFSVPVCWEEKTIEDDTVNTDEKRLLVYGQKDHVRLYGNDLGERLEKYGFETKLCRVDEKLSKEQIERMCLIPEDAVWVLKKKGEKK